ncbi:MAG: helix-turn-helix domain-containing protein [Akkermansiaceae bacterium]
MSEWTDIGEQLQKARESKGLSLRDVAHTTRIPLATLTALEESDYSIFASPAYARSFLAQYSEFLDVDAHDWVDAFETGDVLSNVNDHGYLQSHNEHVGDHSPQRETPTNSGSRKKQQSEASPSGGNGSSILQTLSVFAMTGLLIGGGIYAYNKFEPMLMGAIQETEEDPEKDQTASADEPPTKDTTPKPDKETSPDTTSKPPLVAQNTPEAPPKTTSTTGAPEAPDTPEATKPPKRRNGPPPKALIVEEDE